MNTLKHKKIDKITAAQFDEDFDQGDVTEHLNIKSAKAHYPTQRITIDFPKNILESVDVEAARIGVTRTSLIKLWVAEHLNKQRKTG